MSETMEKLRKLFGPYKQYPFFFVDHPEANTLLDAIPKLLDIAEAARSLRTSGPCERLSKCGCGPCQLDRAIAALEAMS